MICVVTIVVIGMAFLLNQCDNKNALSDEQHSETSDTNPTEQKDDISSTVKEESAGENPFLEEQSSISGSTNSDGTNLSQPTNSGSQNSVGQDENSGIADSEESESGESEWTELYPAIPID